MDNSKNKIKEIAYKLFKEHGYAKVSLKDICEAAQISKTTFYYYFSSKETLLEDFINQPLPMTLDAVNIVFSMDSHWEQLWYLTYITTAEIVKIGPEIYKQVIQSNMESNKGTFDLLNNRATNVFIPIIKKGQEAGEFLNKTPVETLIQMSWTMRIGLLVQWCINNGNFDLAEREIVQLQNLFQIDEKYHFTLESFKEKYSL